jgi:DNA topoisomerase VI subunit B
LELSLKGALERLVKTERADTYGSLDVLREIHDIKPHAQLVLEQPNGPIAVTLRLMDVVWRYTFWDYFSEKQRRDSGQKG